MQVFFDVLNCNSKTLMVVLWYMLHCYQSRQTLHRHLCTLDFTTLLQILRTALHMEFFSPNIAYYPIIFRRYYIYSSFFSQNLITEQCCVGATGKKCGEIQNQPHYTTEVLGPQYNFIRGRSQCLLLCQVTSWLLARDEPIEPAQSAISAVLVRLQSNAKYNWGQNTRHLQTAPLVRD